MGGHDLFSISISSSNNVRVMQLVLSATIISCFCLPRTEIGSLTLMTVTCSVAQS